MDKAATKANLIQAHFKIATPLFLGGAAQEADGIRPPSIKGALRFWWRALNWGRVLENAGGDEIAALRALHAQEARLFGLAGSFEKGKPPGGQGVFLLSVAARTSPAKLDVDKFSPRSYMLGMGLYGDHKLQRQAMQGEFTLSLRFRRDCGETERASLLEALCMFGLLGGLGSRVRHGWGSLALVGLDGATVDLPNSSADYLSQMRALLGNVNGGEPPFSAFSPLSRLAWTEPHKYPLAVIDQVGAEMGLYRSYGRYDKVFGRKAEQNFRPDHNHMRDAADGKRPAQAPERLVFGLPHNYFFSSDKAKVDIQKTSGDRQRRASPLLLHVHPVDGGFVGVLLLLRSRFLPEQDRVCIKGGRQAWELPVTPAWQRIDEFMARPAFQREGGQ